MYFIASDWFLGYIGRGYGQTDLINGLIQESRAFTRCLTDERNHRRDEGIFGFYTFVFFRCRGLWNTESVEWSALIRRACSNVRRIRRIAGCTCWEKLCRRPQIRWLFFVVVDALNSLSVGMPQEGAYHGDYLIFSSLYSEKSKWYQRKKFRSKRYLMQSVRTRAWKIGFSHGLSAELKEFI